MFYIKVIDGLHLESTVKMIVFANMSCFLMFLTIGQMLGVGVCSLSIYMQMQTIELKEPTRFEIDAL